MTAKYQNREVATNRLNNKDKNNGANGTRSKSKLPFGYTEKNTVPIYVFERRYRVVIRIVGRIVLHIFPVSTKRNDERLCLA